MSLDLDFCPIGYIACDNVCIELFQICCPADSPELDNAGGCMPSQTCVFNGCCDIGETCASGGGGVETNIIPLETDVLEEISSILTGLIPEETGSIFDSDSELDTDLDSDDDITTATEAETEEAVETETAVVPQETGSVIGGGADDDDDDDDDDEVGNGNGNGNENGNVNTVPTRSNDEDTSQSTDDAAPSSFRSGGAAKKALLGLGLFALMAS